MERRTFIKHSALMGIGLAAIPAVGFGQWNRLPANELLAPRFLHTVFPNEQVRHGLMQLPQREALAITDSLQFNSLHAVHRHILLKDAGTREESEAIMDVLSLSFCSPLNDQFSAIQVQLTNEGWMIVTRNEIITVQHRDIAHGMREIAPLYAPANAQLWLGKIDAGKGFQLDSAAQRYMLLLEGEADLNNVGIEEYSGVALDDSALELTSASGATVLMLNFG
jgi:hypothetical protein